jgi:hypothetical protein
MNALHRRHGRIPFAPLRVRMNDFVSVLASQPICIDQAIAQGGKRVPMFVNRFVRAGHGRSQFRAPTLARSAKPIEHRLATMLQLFVYAAAFRHVRAKLIARKQYFHLVADS